MYQVCNAQPAPPSGANPSVTRSLDIIVARALEKDAAARYQDAAAMASDLRACLPELAGAGPAPAVPASGAAPGESTVAATIVMPIAGMHVLTRFDSEAALKRLMEPKGEDRRAMSPSMEPLPFVQRWLSDGALMAAVAVIVAAILAAAYIATT